MPFIIDAHEDLAYNALTFGRDYLRPAAETRRLEKDSETPRRTGHSLLGWPEYQRGQVAAIFATLFLAPERYQAGTWETQVFRETGEARRLLENQLTFYRRLCDDHPDQFRMIYNQRDLEQALEPWEAEPAFLPDPAHPRPEGEPREPVTHPVGLVLLMEGCEGIRAPEEMEEWWEMGVRTAGPVWAGTRFCGGMYEPGEFTSEGFALLEVMAGLGYTLDISHMNEASALQALDRYEGRVIASHSNARALIRGAEGERHLTDLTLRRLVERDGIVGLVPFNRFLRAGWADGDDRNLVTLRMVTAHIDHVCQIAGDALHAAIGTDYDGGFGWPAVPVEIDTIADLQKLPGALAELGYSAENIANILGQNWRRHLESTLP